VGEKERMGRIKSQRRPKGSNHVTHKVRKTANVLGVRSRGRSTELAEPLSGMTARLGLEIKRRYGKGKTRKIAVYCRSGWQYATQSATLALEVWVIRTVNRRRGSVARVTRMDRESVGEGKEGKATN
jgi:rhodanese-related sulfurtransferase